MSPVTHIARRPLVLVILAGALILPACDDGSGLDDIPVTVQGTVTGQGNAPVEGVWVHLLAGPQAFPRSVAADDTDISGTYDIEVEVDPADCNDLHLRVLETQAFDAQADPLDQSLLGSCGDLVADFVISTEPAVPDAPPGPSVPPLRVHHVP